MVVVDDSGNLKGGGTDSAVISREADHAGVGVGPCDDMVLQRLWLMQHLSVPATKGE